VKIIDRKFLDTPTPSVHASSIVFYHGKMFSAWFGGTREGANDVCIYLNNGEKTKTIGENIQLPCWNPIWLVHRDDLYLMYKVGEFCDRWQTFIVRLDEEFNLLGPPQILPAGLNGPVKTKPLIQNDRIYCGSSVETMFDWTCYIEVYDIHNNRFKYCSRSGPLTIPKKSFNAGFGRQRPTSGILQPALWRYDNDNDIHMFMRSSRGLSQMYYARLDTFDHDVARSPMPVTNMANPNSSVDVVCHLGNLYLVCNPNSEERNPLAVYALGNGIDIKYTDMGGPSFPLELTLDLQDELIIGRSEDIDPAKHITQELSYPYMIENEGKLYLSYTYGRSKIAVCTIEI